MILQRPKRKKGQPVKKSPNGSNQLATRTASHGLIHNPLQVVNQRLDGHHCSTQDVNPQAPPRKPAPPDDRSWAQSGPWPGPSRGPMLAPGFPPTGPLLAPPVPHLVDNHNDERVSTIWNQQPALYDLISSKFDAVITSIDGENFSGDRRELGQ
jgi:hypothetical protein